MTNSGRARRYTAVLAVVCCGLAALLLAVVSGEDDNGMPPARTELLGVQAAASLSQGLEERNGSIGRPGARPSTQVRVIGDPKSAGWGRFWARSMPLVVDRLIRPGRATLRVDLIDDAGPQRASQDGPRLVRFLYGAVPYERFFNTVAVAAQNQGLPDELWASRSRLRQIAAAAKVPQRAIATMFATTPTTLRRVRSAAAFAEAESVNEVSVLVRTAGRRGYRRWNPERQSVRREIAKISR